MLYVQQYSQKKPDKSKEPLIARADINNLNFLISKQQCLTRCVKSSKSGNVKTHEMVKGNMAINWVKHF